MGLPAPSFQKIIHEILTLSKILSKTREHLR